MNDFASFRVKPGRKVSLGDVDPGFTGDYSSRDDVAEEFESSIRQLRALQERLYAERQRSLLICLQALDAGGKDGTIRHVLGAMNPQGCKVVSFKEPSHIELDHDFLWRIHQHVPIKGEVGVFNRSHYEDVLVAHVHNLAPKEVIKARYGQINAFEELLVSNQTHILKFFLHISKAEQLKRFKARLDDPTKQWKIQASDYTERKRWDSYMEAFEQALSKCSTKHAPWFIIPADHKWFRDLAVAQIVVQYLDGLNMTYPPPAVDLAQIRQAYHEAANAGDG